MQNVIIFCISKLYKGNAAGSARTLNYAKLLADNNVNVYFSHLTTRKIVKEGVKSFGNHLYFVESNSKNPRLRLFRNFINSFLYAYWLASFAKKLEGKTSFLLYPSSDPSLELPAILIIKGIFRFSLFCEMNELRYAITKDHIPHPNALKNLLITIQKKMQYRYYKFNEYLSKYFDGIIVISTRLEKYYSKYNKNIIRIPILTDTHGVKIKPKPLFDHQNDIFIISFTGQVELKKEGIHLLIGAIGAVCKEFKNVVLHLYGPVPKIDKQIIDQLISNFSLKNNVFLHGMVNQDEIMNILQQSHLLILLRPSNLQNDYGFSTKLSEYMISGTPILMSNVSDINLYVKNNENGFIAREMNEAVIASRIVEIINNYNIYKDTVPLKSFETARNDFDYRNYLERVTIFITAK